MPDEALRYNEGKPEYWLIPPNVLAFNARRRGVQDCFFALQWFLTTHDKQMLLSTLLLIVKEAEPDADVAWYAGLRMAARVLRAGQAKYPAHNWLRGASWSMAYASLIRHLVAYDCDEETDSETGLPHLAHAACNAVMLLHYMQQFPEKNDLPKLAASVVEPVEDGDYPSRKANC